MLWLKACAPYPHGERDKRKPGRKKNADKNIWTVLSSSPGSVRASGSGAPHDSTDGEEMTGKGSVPRRLV